MFCGSTKEMQDKLQEVALLIRCKGHENVVKYFKSESDSDFIYIALELCDGNLQQ